MIDNEETSFEDTKLYFYEPKETSPGTSGYSLHKVESLYLCDNTRPYWMNQSDNEEKSTTLSDNFPIEPFSKDSLEIYKNLKALWRTEPTELEVNGDDDDTGKTDEQEDDEEEIITVECEKCLTFDDSIDISKPKIESNNLNSVKSSKASPGVSLTDTSYKPKDILKEIIEKVNERVKEQFYPELKKTLKEDVKCEGGDSKNGSLKGVESIISFGKERPETLHFYSSKRRNSSNISKSSEEMMQSLYLKPEECLESFGKAKYNETSIKDIKLMEKLDRNDLKELKTYFFPKNVDYQKVIMEKGVKNKEFNSGVPLKKLDFQQAIDNIFGVKEYTQAAGKLFETLQIHGKLKENVLWWEQLLDAFIESTDTIDKKLNLFTLEELKTSYKPFTKTPIVKLIKTMNGYTAVARLGSVGVFNQNFQLKYSYKVAIQQFKSKNCCWLTDACYSIESETLFIIASSRALYLYNTSRIHHQLIQTVEGMKEIPESINFTRLNTNQALLLIGTNSGDVIHFNFKQTNKSFFKFNAEKDNNNCYFWQDVLNQKEWVDISIEKRKHHDIILQIEYLKENDCIITGSLDKERSIIISHRQPNRVPYVFAIEKGVILFRLDINLGMLATISRNDVQVKLWDPINVCRPIGYLKGAHEHEHEHEHTVLDVVLIYSKKMAVTYAKNQQINLWDLIYQTCLQTFKLNFPKTVCRTHLLITMKMFYINYEQQILSENKSLIEEYENERDLEQQEIKEIIIVKGNLIKGYKVNFQNEIQHLTEKKEDLPDDSKEDNEIDEQKCDNIFEFIKENFTKNENQFKYKNLGRNKYLRDYIKEGTPILALDLQKIENIPKKYK